MTETLSLFDVDEPRARRTDPATSHAAAARSSLVQGKLRAQILDLLGRTRGMTKNETCLHLKIDPIQWPSVASALSQLKVAGILEWSGEIRAHQNVWRLREQNVDVQNGTL